MTDDYSPDYGPDYGPEYAQGAALTPAREARDELTRLLSGMDIPVMIHSDIPQHITPPAIVLMPNSDWILPDTFGGYRINLDLMLIANSEGSAESGLRRLEDMIFSVLERVNPTGPIVSPQSTTLNDGGAAVIITTIPISFTTREEQ